MAAPCAESSQTWFAANPANRRGRTHRRRKRPANVDAIGQACRERSVLLACPSETGPQHQKKTAAQTNAPLAKSVALFVGWLPLDYSRERNKWACNRVKGVLNRQPGTGRDDPSTTALARLCFLNSQHAVAQGKGSNRTNRARRLRPRLPELAAAPSLPTRSRIPPPALFKPSPQSHPHYRPEAINRHAQKLPQGIATTVDKTQKGRRP